QLYSAALQDQELFNALADEQALKELLADPVVRRRLLQALQKSSSTAPSSPSLDWFRRPAGLAWAGGLAAAFFAIILGTRICQDSVKEAGRSIATEEATHAAAPAPSVTKPTAPPINEPRLNTQDNATSSGSPKTNALAGKMAKRETTAMVVPEERRARNSLTDSLLQQPEQDGLQKQAESMSDKRATSNEEAPASADHRPASAPSTSAVTPAPTKVPTTAAPTSQVASALSARSMFYGERAELDTALMAKKQEPSQSAQQSGRFEQKKGALVAGKPPKVIGVTKPLGIRYSLTADGGIERPRRDKDAGATNQASSIELMIDVNQDGYLQVWGETESLQHHLLFPIPENEQLSSRLITHQPRIISVAAGYGAIILRFSRILFDSSIKEAIVLSGRSSLGQLQESVTTDEASGFHERTTYVVNKDLSVPELLVRLPIGKP
ncbi:MAG: hypothetical protein ABL950_14150, partial [Nitrospira sp.]